MLARADSDDIGQGRDELLAVSEFPRPRRADEGGHDFFREVVRHHHLDFDLGQEVHLVLAAPVGLGMTLLPAEPLDLADGHAHDSDVLEGGLDRLQQMGPHDSFDLLHFLSFGIPARSSPPSIARRLSSIRGSASGSTSPSPRSPPTGPWPSTFS